MGFAVKKDHRRGWRGSRVVSVKKEIDTLDRTRRVRVRVKWLQHQAPLKRSVRPSARGLASVIITCAVGESSADADAAVQVHLPDGIRTVLELQLKHQTSIHGRRKRSTAGAFCFSVMVPR